MTNLERLIRRARFRVTTDRAILGAGRGLVIGAGVALAVLAIERIAGAPVAAAAYPLLAGAGLAVGLVAALGRRPDRLAIAVRLDRHLRLKDRLGTAQSLASGRTDGGFGALVHGDAERLASRLDIRSATPVRVTGVWTAAAALAAALGVGVAFMPRVAWAAASDAVPPEREALERRRADIAGTIDRAVAGLDERPADDRSRGDLETLERLAEQMSAAESEPQLAEARDRSAAHLDEMAERLAEDARRNLEALDAVAQRVSGFDEADREDPGAPPSEFTDALRRGEFDEAAERFEELARAAESLPQAERDRVAGQLRQLAEQVGEPDSQEQEPAPPLDERRRQLRDALEDLGVDEQTAEQVLDEPDPRAARDRLEDEGIDEELARQLARDLEDLEHDRQVEEQAAEQRRRLSEALQDAAQRIEDESPEPEPEPDHEQPEAQPQPGEQQQSRQQQQGEQQQGQQQQGQQQQGEQQRRQQREQPGGRREGSQETPTQAPGEQPGAEPSQRPADVPRKAPGDVPEVLRGLDRMRREALERRADSEQLREAARKLADSMSEQDKRRLMEQWMETARDRGPEPGGSPEGPGRPVEAAPDQAATFEQFEDVDLRDEPGDEQGRIIAEWLDADAPDGPGGQARRRDAFGEARSRAEQAVEQSAVPSRYHSFIRRFFGRLDEAFEPDADADGSGDGGS